MRKSVLLDLVTYVIIWSVGNHKTIVDGSLFVTV